jgi:hypothetical protein
MDNALYHIEHLEEGSTLIVHPWFTESAIPVDHLEEGSITPHRSSWVY